MPMHSSPAPMRKVPKAQNPYHADDGLDIPMEGPLLPTSVRLGGGGKAAVIERIERRVGAPLLPTGAWYLSTHRKVDLASRNADGAALEAEDEDGVGYLEKAIAAAQADAVTEVQECGFRPGAAERVNPQPDVLVSIRLQHNPLENYGLGVLAGAISSCAPLTLQSLCLRSVMAGDDGMAVLAVALSNFEGGTGVSLLNLELTDNRLSPASGSHLAAVVAAQERLQDLQLAQNALGDEGASALSAGLLRNQSLTKLSLGSNGIGAEGARALAGGLALHRSLSTLALHHNALRGADGCEAVRSLAVACQPLRRLRLGGNPLGAGAAGAFVSEADTIPGQPPSPTKGGGGLLGTLFGDTQSGAVRLTHLLLEGVSLTIGGAPRLRALLSSPLCAVELLWLANNNLRDAHALEIAAALRGGNGTLRRVWLEHNRITVVGASALLEAARPLSALEQIALEGNDLSAHDCAALERRSALLQPPVNVRARIGGRWSPNDFNDDPDAAPAPAPTMVRNAASTIVVEPGGSVVVEPDGTIVVEPAPPASPPAEAAEAPPPPASPPAEPEAAAEETTQEGAAAAPAEAPAEGWIMPRNTEAPAEAPAAAPAEEPLARPRALAAAPEAAPPAAGRGGRARGGGSSRRRAPAGGGVSGVM